MLTQTDLGFAKGPIFVAHRSEHGQQLRLRKAPLLNFVRCPGKTAWLA
jgi:hypothetical protein